MVGLTCFELDRLKYVLAGMCQPHELFYKQNAIIQHKCPAQNRNHVSLTQAFTHRTLTLVKIRQCASHCGNAINVLRSASATQHARIAEVQYLQLLLHLQQCTVLELKLVLKVRKLLLQLSIVHLHSRSC